MRLFEDVAYCEAPVKPTAVRPLLLDLYLPAGEAKRPLLIWIHGGAWRMGNHKRPPAVPLFTDAGFAVASISYRLSPEALFPAQIRDCLTAVRFLRAHAGRYNLNPDRVGVWGASAGGHLAALVGLAAHVPAFATGDHADQPAAVQAVCDWYGPTDFLQMDDHLLPGTAFTHNPADSPESQLVGGPIQAHPNQVATANPISYIGAEPIPPFLLMHGDQDPLVPFHQSVLLHEALQAAGANVTFVPLAGAGHGGEGFRKTAVLQTVLGFFQQHLEKQ